VIKILKLQNSQTKNKQFFVQNHGHIFHPIIIFKLIASSPANGKKRPVFYRYSVSRRTAFAQQRASKIATLIVVKIFIVDGGLFSFYKIYCGKCRLRIALKRYMKRSA
jgi:hypothetical protein